MAGKSGSSSKHSANSTGKAGNASGSARREARGDPARRSGGKHPPSRIFSAPQSEAKARSRVRRARGSQQSERG
jgi:hypothetical protein